MLKLSLIALVGLKPSITIPGNARENVMTIRKSIINPIIPPINGKNTFKTTARIIKNNDTIPIIIDETIPLKPYLFAK